MSLRTKIVTAYWMDCSGYPFYSAASVRKFRYLGSLASHCKGIDLPIICYTHQRNYDELLELKNSQNLGNLEIKLLELSEMQIHPKINEVRERLLSERLEKELDGRGPEIMWGKFDAVEREFEDADMVYWVDCGLQNPHLFPWRYSTKYPSREDHDFTNPETLKAKNWGMESDAFDFRSIFNTKIFDRLNELNRGKITFFCSETPNVNFGQLGPNVVDYAIQGPYPVGGVIGGDIEVYKKFMTYFWEAADRVLANNVLCTEEALMKLVYDKIREDEKISLVFYSWFHGFDYNQMNFHFSEYDSETAGYGKPFYTLFNDIFK